ncbi:class I SAM-dependent methyltransferase [Microbacterium kyungheense]|uniref:Methyltransferase family protein n=1 Tax=Microbacterium kyungheense TaxID=1263636 RepID=A0A543FKW9_9MICO|nr:class I SAM-dependent methyltransferase [Microbacterium kyungheense]TQM34519.1 methyltransferase family protein [Microbacterium kyungheense]
MELSVEAGPARQGHANAPFWLTPAAYWMPAHFPTSAWWTHGAFAAWIVDAVRPSVVVELGTHFGYSCFAFAEAAKRLGLRTTINALDTWEGDHHAGFYGEEVFEYVDGVARSDYPESVRLVRGRFDESRSLFPDRSVDLLHIDGRHGYEDVLADFSEWRSAVRPGGVVLFHDIAEKGNGFGVWRLWDEVATHGRSFAFSHGHGLGVLSIGEPTTPSLRALFEADAATADRIRADFGRLGDVAARQAWLLTLPRELDQLRAEVQSRASHEEQQEVELDAQRKHIQAMTDSSSWRITAPLRAMARRCPRGRASSESGIPPVP